MTTRWAKRIGCKRGGLRGSAIHSTARYTAAAKRSRKNLRRLHVRQETPHFALQAGGFDRQRVGQRLDVGGGRAGAGGGAGDAAHGLGAGARFDRGAVDAFGDRGDRVVLFLDRGGDRHGDLRHVVDDRGHLLDGLRGIGGGRLDRADLGGDVFGGARGLRGQRFHFGGD